MRSLWSLFLQSWQEDEAHQGDGAPEGLRAGAIATSARVTLLASLVALPLAVFLLTQGAILGFATALVGIAGGSLGVAFVRRSQYEAAARAVMCTTLAAGLALTLADPAFVDFGLGVAALAPIQAALLSRSRARKWSWAGLAAVGTVSAVGAGLSIGLSARHYVANELVGGLAFALVAGLVAYAALRLGEMFEVYERGQINAYKHLVEHVQDAVFRFAPDGAASFVSRSAEKLFGCRRYELTGNRLVERVHVLDRPGYLTAFAEANADGMARRVEIRMRRDDTVPGAAPSYMWVEASLSPVTETGTREGRHEVVMLLRDVTDRHDRELELQRARKVAEEASVAKTRFLATIGHELRTPLNAIVGFSEMMTSGVVGELSDTHKEYATLIRQSGHHLIDVVKMLLDMSRLEAGKFELQTEAFAPESLADPCLKLVDAMARDKSIRLMTDIPRALPMLVADERVCRQVLLNLLSNAIKFSHEHSVVTLGMRRQGRHVAISVTDQGIGMGEESVRRIGEPFFQAQDGLSRRYEGTGLGLSIVKGLVELHDGSLHASSSPGTGTVMTVLLPINGPETKLVETAPVTPLHRDAVPQHMPKWLDERKRAL